MISFLLAVFHITADLIVTFVGLAVGVLCGWLAFHTGVRLWAALILGVAIGILPATYVKGRNDERKTANVAALRDTIKALEIARDASNRIADRQSKSATEEQLNRIDVERKLAEAEAEARAKDAQIEQASTFTCPAVAPSQPDKPAAPPVQFTCPSTYFSDDELRDLRMRHGAGPLRRARRPSPPR